MVAEKLRQQPLTSNIGYGGIDVFLRLRVFGRRVVTHIAMVHHFQETVGAEEVRQVFLCCIMRPCGGSS